MKYEELLDILMQLFHGVYYEEVRSGHYTARTDEAMVKELADKIWNMKKEK